MLRAKYGIYKMPTPLRRFGGSSLNLSWRKFGVWLGDWWIPSLYASLCLSDHSTLRILIWWFSMLNFYIHLWYWHANDIDWSTCLSYHIDFALAMIVLFTLAYIFTLLYILFVLVLILLLVCYLDHLWACYPCCYSSWLSYSHLACVWTLMIYLHSVWLLVAWLFLSHVITCCLSMWVPYLSPHLQPSSFSHSFFFRFLHLQVWGLVCTCFSSRASG